ncbi:MAG: hypothetical protein ACI9GM_000729 [Salibacteraceae bacterium]|jgi:hypothetical protein
MKNTLILIFIFVVVASCSNKEDSEIQVLESDITAISSPKQAIVGDNVSVQVNFTGPNGCTEPYSIEANKVGQTITLRAFYSEPIASICTEQVLNHSLNYSFFADLPGAYFFISEMDNSVTDTLVVF